MPQKFHIGFWPKRLETRTTRCAKAKFESFDRIDPGSDSSDGFITGEGLLPTEIEDPKELEKSRIKATFNRNGLEGITSEMPVPVL